MSQNQPAPTPWLHGSVSRSLATALGHLSRISPIAKLFLFPPCEYNKKKKKKKEGKLWKNEIGKVRSSCFSKPCELVLPQQSCEKSRKASYSPMVSQGMKTWAARIWCWSAELW